MPVPHIEQDLTAATPASPFSCPGETTPVSRAVHLARLYAGWSGCDHCPWNSDAEGLADSSRILLESIREQRRNGIRRTEFGVRGVWQNQIDRRMAGALVRVFCDALLRGTSNRPRQSETPGTQTDADSEIQPQRLRLLPVAIGYDHRASSLDIFAGVTAAVREFGFPVVDIGRCTSASLVEAVRSIDDVQAGIFVTGSGAPAAWTGFDVLDTLGDPVAVRWKDYGIRISSTERDASAVAHSANDRPTQHGAGLPVAVHILDVTDPDQLTKRLRAARDFGAHRQVGFEERYRDSLLRWFPNNSHLAVLMTSPDPLIRQRVDWLAATRDLNLMSANPDHETADASRAIRLSVHDDDRVFRITRVSGEPVLAEQLALRINNAIRSASSQITAHADGATNRFWLTDAARPGSATGCENISDALATAGLIMRLSADDHPIL